MIPDMREYEKYFLFYFNAENNSQWVKVYVK